MSNTGLFGLYTYGCPEGFEPENLLKGVVPLCYPRCPAGFERVSFLCSSTCNQKVQTPPTDPPTLINSGNDWRDVWISCQKNLYDRGIGLLPDSCSDPGRSVFMGMCYTNCPSGLTRTTWAPTSCSQACPPNTVEGGFANCTKVNEYGRGIGRTGSCPANFTNMGLHCHNWNLGEQFGHVSGFVCNNTCTYTAVDGQIATSSSTGNYYYGNPYYTIDDPNPWPNVFDGVEVTVPISHTGDRWQNTRQANRNDPNCATNTDGLCYPQCDVGFINAGCCICTPTCGDLTDDGVTCRRRTQDVGPGRIPDACTDPDRQFTEGLCYNTCQNNYVGFATTCTRQGCPFAGVGETPLSCLKNVIYLGGSRPGIPNFSDKINGKFNVGTIQNGARRIAMNGFVIALCAIFAFLLIYANITLRSRPLKLPA